MSENSPAIDHKHHSYPYPGETNYQLSLPARSLIPHAPFDYMRGASEWEFTMFAGTKDSVIIPYRGYHVTETAKKELTELTPETVKQEPLNEFYRHTYMLQKFGIPERVKEFLPIVLQRTTTESADYAASLYPAQPDKQQTIKNDFYFIKLACLEKIEEDPSLTLDQDMIEDLYTEALTTRSRSLEFALRFDKRNQKTGQQVDIADRIKTYLLPKLITQETKNDKQTIELLKWSHSDYTVQFDLLRESLLQGGEQEQIDTIAHRFFAAMEPYDIATYLQQYTVEHPDFQPKLDMVFNYLDRNPPQSQQQWDKKMSSPTESRTPISTDTPTESYPTFEERKPSAKSSTITQKTNEQRSREDILKELNSLDPKTLERELFQDFARHTDLLAQFGEPDIVARFLPTILKRGRIGATGYSLPKNEFTLEKNGLPSELKEQAYLKIMSCLEVYEENAYYRLPKNAVQDLWMAAWDSNPRFLRYALVFNERNKMYGEALPIDSQIVDYCARNIIRSDNGHREKVDSFLEWAYIKPELYSQMLIKSLYSLPGTQKEAAIKRVQRLIPYMGTELVRKTLKEYLTSLENANSDYNLHQFSELANTIFSYLQPNPEEKVVTNLTTNFYDQLNFAEYKPNEAIQEKELSILTEALGDTKNILDVACGTGRHLLALDKKDGRHVTGIDLVPRHIEYIKQLDADSDVHVGSWYSLPFKDEEFDAAYCLGRSFPHNTTIPDAIECLKEMGRVVKNFVVVDLPDPTKGTYKKLIQRSLEYASQNGIDNILRGSIIDSPDNEHFCDRYMPDEEAFTALCELAGLKAEKLQKTISYRIAEDDNVNTYWKLTKLPPDYDMTIDRRAELLQIIRQTPSS